MYKTKNKNKNKNKTVPIKKSQIFQIFLGDQITGLTVNDRRMHRNRVMYLKQGKNW